MFFTYLLLGTIKHSIRCSFFMNNHGGILLLITKWPNIIVGFLEGISVNSIHGYAQSKAAYYVLELIMPCILYMLHGY